MHRPERTAWLALLYRACERNQHIGVLSHLDDLDSCPGEISLATLEAAQVFSDLDWQLVSLLIDKPEHAVVIAELLLLEGDALRSEALLHAPGDPSPPEEAWAARFAGSRWQEVRRAIATLVGDGLTASMEAVEELAMTAYRQLTGNSYEDYLDDYEEYLFPEYADA
jgi:hypothetical protein